MEKGSAIASQLCRFTLSVSPPSPLLPVCSARVIFESDLLQDFLQIKRSNVPTASGGGGGGGGGTVTVTATRTVKPAAQEEKDVQLRVFMPDKSVVMITIQEYWRTDEVYDVSCTKNGTPITYWGRC